MTDAVQLATDEGQTTYIAAGIGFTVGILLGVIAGVVMTVIVMLTKRKSSKHATRGLEKMWSERFYSLCTGSSERDTELSAVKYVYSTLCIVGDKRFGFWRKSHR